MATNNFLLFADSATNLLSQSDYSTDNDRINGNKSSSNPVARSNLMNKVLRQSTKMSTVLAQFIVDNANVNASDTDSVSTLENNFVAALQAQIRSNTFNNFASTTSSQLASVISDETGSGSLVFANTPTLITPNIGVATGTSFNSITGLSSTTPSMDGTATIGTSTTAARADHIHPSDTSKANVATTLAGYGITDAYTKTQVDTLAGNYVLKTTTVNGHALSGNISVTASDIGLGNVDNTADANKNVLSATKLTTARTINGVSFDGTANITVYDDTKQATLVSGTNIKTIGGISLLGSGDITVNQTVNQYVALPTKVAYNQISVNGTTLTLSSPTAGTDYYFSKTAITTSIQSDTIGGFHYGLTPSGETPTGNKTTADITAIAGINAYSIWTNWNRPNCDPRGMVKVGDIWVDIYLADSRYGIRKYSAPTSITGYKIAAGTTDYGREIPLIPSEFGGNGSSNYGKLTWFQANEIAKASGKRSLKYSEFPAAMYGVLEQTDSSSYDSGGGNIFHIATLASKYGIEQATGTQWVWGDDVQGIGGDGWKTETGVTDSRGSIYAYTNQPTAVILGSSRDNGSYGGSRASYWSSYVWYSYSNVGCRFACDHLKLV